MTAEPTIVSMADMIAEVKRELKLRVGAYAKRVNSGLMTEAEADRQTARMTEVLHHLMRSSDLLAVLNQTLDGAIPMWRNTGRAGLPPWALPAIAAIAKFEKTEPRLL